jgi:hypothetical protein
MEADRSKLNPAGNPCPLSLISNKNRPVVTDLNETALTSIEAAAQKFKQLKYIVPHIDSRQVIGLIKFLTNQRHALNPALAVGDGSP